MCTSGVTVFPQEAMAAGKETSLRSGAAVNAKHYLPTNAANGNGGLRGDKIYTVVLPVPEPTSGVQVAASLATLLVLRRFGVRVRVGI